MRHAYAYIRRWNPFYVHGDVRIFDMHEVVGDMLGRSDSDIFSSMQVEVH